MPWATTLRNKTWPHPASGASKTASGETAKPDAPARIGVGDQFGQQTRLLRASQSGQLPGLPLQQTSSAQSGKRAK